MVIFKSSAMRWHIVSIFEIFLNCWSLLISSDQTFMLGATDIGATTRMQVLLHRGKLVWHI